MCLPHKLPLCSCITLPQWQILVELKFHGKLKFKELKFQNNGRLPYIFETMVDVHIFYKNVLFGYFDLFIVHIKEEATNQCDLDEESKAKARLF